jgi:hypothetical protein
MPNDRRVGEQPGDVALAKSRHANGVEAGEGAPEGVALVEDGEPAEAGLEAF